jgi:MFS family permease
MVSLFISVAAIGTAMVGASTASTLIVSGAAGEGWSGVPMAAGVLGTAAGALGGGFLVALRGIRYALLLMYGLAAAGAGLAFAGAATGSLLPLLLGMTLLGVGAGAGQLSRYAAAELYPDEHKGFGLSVIVWAGTVGAIAGPALLAPAAAAAERLELIGLSGPFLLAGVVVLGAAAVSFLLPRMARTTVEVPVAQKGTLRTLRSRVVAGPLSAMVAAHVAMVGVMVMTPLQLEHGGHGLAELGWVLGAHMVGMFALAPLSGRIADRFGARTAIYSGIGVLALSVMTVVLAPTSHDVGLPLGLFLLGYGWNLVFVGGSKTLARELAPEQRARVQGAVDACIWSASALASLAAGPLFGLGGLVLVAIVAGVIAAAPLLLLGRR